MHKPIEGPNLEALNENEKRINEAYEVRGEPLQSDQPREERRAAITAAADQNSYGVRGESLESDQHQEERPAIPAAADQNSYGLINRLLPAESQDRLVNILEHLTSDLEGSLNKEEQNDSSEIRTYAAPSQEDLEKSAIKEIIDALKAEIHTFRSDLPNAMINPEKRREIMGTILTHTLARLSFNNYTVRSLLNRMQQEGFTFATNLVKKGCSVNDFHETELQKHLEEMKKLLNLTSQLAFFNEDNQITVSATYGGTIAQSLEDYKNKLLKTVSGGEFSNDEDHIIYIMGRIYQANFIIKVANILDQRLEQIFNKAKNTPNPTATLMKLKKEHSLLTRRFDAEEPREKQNKSFSPRIYLVVDKEPLPGNEHTAAQILHFELAVAELQDYFKNLSMESQRQPKM